MNSKILIFLGWVLAGINAAIFLALFLKTSPAIGIGAAIAFLGFSVLAAVIAFFAPSTRPWLSLGFAIVLMGGLVWLR
jgi:hypothetical protein